MPELLGTWENDDMWTFKKSGKNAYELTINEKESSKESGGIAEYDEAGIYEVHLVKLGKFLFLDFYPEEIEIEEYGYDVHFVPVHSFCRVWFEKDVLRLAFFENEWLEGMIDEKKINIAHVRLEDRVVLTAPIEELQKFVLKYAEDSEAFLDIEELSRQKQD